MNQFDRLTQALRVRLIDHMRDVGEGPGDKSTTEHEAREALRALNTEELGLWLRAVTP